MTARCVGCSGIVGDDDVTYTEPGGAVWHYRCWCAQHQREVPRSTATLIERQHDIQKEISLQRLYGLPAHAIAYCISPSRFTLDIPVEALAGLSPDAHTRMLAMLNAWITEHKPVVVKGPTP